MENNIKRLEKSFVSYLCERTEEFSRINGYNIEKEDNDLSDKGKKLLKIIEDNDFNCQKKAVIELLSCLIGEKIPFTVGNEKIREIMFSVVVPLHKQIGSHNYAIDSPVLCLSRGRGFPKENSVKDTGNVMTSFKEYLRPATKEEIIDLVEQIKEGFPGGLINFNNTYTRFVFIKE